MHRFIDALRQKLEAAFPETVLNVNNSEIDSLVHVHYKDFNYIVEYTPLLVTYLVLLLYIYFSVREFRFVCKHVCGKHTLTQLHTYVHADIYAYTHTCMHASMHTHAHVHTHTHTQTRTHTHTHTHTHTTHKVFVYSCILLLTHLLVQTHMSNFAIYFEVPMCMTLMRVCLYPV